MRHVDQQVGTDLVGDISEALPIDHPRVGREAGDDHTRLVLAGQGRDLRVVDLAGRRVQAVLDRMVELAGKIGLGAVGQMTAMGQAHAQHRIARLTQGHEDRRVGLRAGVRLHVGIVGAKQLLDTLDGKPLRDVHVLAATVVALGGIALGILVGQHRALRLHHPGTRVVLRRDQLDVLLLPPLLVANGLSELVVVAGDLHVGVEHRTPRFRKSLR